jgi:hypothetical protein
MTTRALLTVLGVVAATVLAVPAAAAPASSGAACQRVDGMALSFHPAADNGFPSLAAHGVIADQGLLDAFAREFAEQPHVDERGQVVTGSRDVESFFLWWLPNRVNDIAAGAAPPAGTAQRLDLRTTGGLGRALWLQHLSGWYSGVWLHLTQGMTGDTPVTDADADHVYRSWVDLPRQVSLTGTPQQVLAFNRAALRGGLPPILSTLTVKVTENIMPPNDDVGQFGFDTGFLRWLLPPSPNASSTTRPFAEPYFRSDPTRLLDATYALPEPDYLVAARAAWGTALDADGAVAARRNEAIDGRLGEEPLVVHQLRYHAEATALYSVGIPGGTKYSGYGGPRYDRLLAWAAYAAMTNQANAYNALSAYSRSDVELGRRHARGNAFFNAYLYVYDLGVADNRADGKAILEAFPRFVERAGSCN